jgi:hypothetical protein
MNSTIRLGPILGVESDNLYTICLLTKDSTNAVTVTIDGQIIDAAKVGVT